MAPSTPSPPRLHALPTLLADFEATTAALQVTHGQLTEQVAQLHAQLSTAQMRMQLLLESLSAAVIVVHDERVLHFNRASRKWLPDLGLGQRWQLPAHWQAGPSPGEYRLPREQGAVT